jgi:hypothetical protein
MNLGKKTRKGSAKRNVSPKPSMRNQTGEADESKREIEH